MPCCGNMCAGLDEEGRESASSQTMDRKQTPEKEVCSSSTASEAHDEKKSCTKTTSESHSTQTKAILCIRYLHDILLWL